MSAITTHVLDVSIGRPAAGVDLLLERGHDRDAWMHVARDETDGDGRVRALLPATMSLSAGTYRLTFGTRAYFERQGVRSFYPRVAITFEVTSDAHYHVPLLVSPFGYSTYRGS